MTVSEANVAPPGQHRPPDPKAAAARPATTFRPDIQGLRAIAVSLVLVYHLFPRVVSGGFVGVDVFFVISGFLITSHLLRHPPRRPADLADFWRSRARRLLPAALVVVTLSLVLSRLVAPVTRWHDIATQAIASAWYVQNWTLAAQSVDYLAADNAATPFQHFWSLAVEEQFYLLWPILVLLAVALAHRGRRGRTMSPATAVTADRPAIALLVIAVVIASLGASVFVTAQHPALAYFFTPARMWELALGGALTVFAAPLGRLPARVGNVLSLLGLAAIAVGVLTLSGSTPFPGTAALIPVLGAGLVIGTRSRLVSSALAIRPARWLGDISYSVYLWHYPLIVLTPYLSGHRLTGVERVGLVALTLVLATVQKRFIEDPLRGRPAWPWLRLTLIGMLVVTLLAGSLLLEIRLRSADDATRVSQALAGKDPCLGAGALAAGAARCPIDLGRALIPAPEVAATDKSSAYADDCWTNAPYAARHICRYGTGPIQVALVGNSHAGQWLPALQLLAAERGWTITTYLVSQCNATDAQLSFDTAAKTSDCLAWSQWAQRQTSGNRYKLVITSERQSVPVLRTPSSGQRAAAKAGYQSYLRRWRAAGTRLVVLRDTPDPGRTLTSVPDCVAAHLHSWTVCSGSRAQWASVDPLADAARSFSPQIDVLDLTARICAPTRCDGVTGGVITYFDASHLTATYAATLVPYLKAGLDRALPG